MNTHTLMKQRMVHGAFALFLCCACVFGQELVSDEEEIAVDVSRLDRVQEWVTDYLFSCCDSMDSYLADRMSRILAPYDEPIGSTLDELAREGEIQGSLIRVSPSVEWEEGGVLEYDVRFDANINLPSFEHRLKLVVNNSDDDDELLRGIEDRATRRQRVENDEDELAGLRLRVVDKTRFKADVDAGLKFKPEVVPKLRARFRVSRDLGKWNVNLSESVFWESDDGFGEKTQFEMRRRLDDQTVFRSITAATWTETTKGVALGHTFLLSHQLSDKTVAILKVGMTGRTEEDSGVKEYNLRLAMLRQTYRKWLVLELEPGLVLREENLIEDFDAIPLVTFRMHILFGAIDRWW